MNFEKGKFTGGKKGKGWWGIWEGWWGISPPVNMLKNALDFSYLTELKKMQYHDVAWEYSFISIILTKTT